MANFLNSNNQLLAVEWGESHLWDIKFYGSQTPGGAFSGWFPAVSVDEPISVLTTADISTPQGTYKIPRSGEQKELKVTFYDDVNHSLSNWIREWIDVTILGNGLYVLPLEQSMSSVMIIKSDKQGNTMMTTDYNVFPEGTITYQGTSEGGIPLYDVNFIVVG